MIAAEKVKQKSFSGGLLLIKDERVIYADDGSLSLLNCEESIIGQRVDSFFGIKVLPSSAEEFLCTIMHRDSVDIRVVSFASPGSDDEFLLFLSPVDGMISDPERKNTIEENFNSVLPIIESMNDDVLITDGNGIILRVFPSFEEVFGISEKEILGTSVYDGERQGLFIPSVVAIALRERKKVTKLQESILGGRFPCTAVPVFNENNEIIRVITYGSSTYELTQIKELYEELEDLENQMERYSSEIRELREKEISFPEIISESPQMKSIVQLSVKVAEVDINLLITGESGVGKNLLTKLIHQHSLRRDGPFIEINCGAIPETLLESELFGYEPGSFTGARRDGKIGMIELAHSGTLFLDEIGELSLNLQVKLLKVIQEKKLTKLGGTETTTVDCRIISATNRDLQREIREGNFREDLYYRLNVVPITIPPLRERKEDLLAFITYFLKKANQKYSKKKFFTSDSMDLFLRYYWYGNVRELKNIIERMVITTDRARITPSELPLELQNFAPLGTAEGISLKSAKEMIEKELITKSYKRYKTTVGVAKSLKISQASAARKIKRYIPDIHR